MESSGFLPASKDKPPQGEQRHLCFPGEPWETITQCSPLLLSSLPSPQFPSSIVVYATSPVSASPPPGPRQMGDVFMGGAPDDGFGAGAGRFCRTSRGGEQGAPFIYLCAECRGQIRAPTVLSASHRQPLSPFRSLRVSLPG